jgi:hypothetical protein
VKLIAEVVFGIVAAIATVRLPQVWREASFATQKVPAWWFWGESGWRALIRTRTVAVPVAWLILLTVVTGSAFNSERRSSASSIGRRATT